MNTQRIQLTEQEAAKALNEIGRVVVSYKSTRTVVVEDRDSAGKPFTKDTAESHMRFQLSRIGIDRVVIFKPCAEYMEDK